MTCSEVTSGPGGEHTPDLGGSMVAMMGRNAPRKRGSRPEPAHRVPADTRPRGSSTTPMIQLPPALRGWLDGWGRCLVRDVLDARGRWLREHNMSDVVEACPHLAGPRGGKLSIGTDCSGADAPIFALRAMNVAHRHTFSCDNAAGPQQFIKLNTQPDGTMFTDLMQRDPASVPAHQVYVAGFPCKAFSLLNAKSRQFKEQSARPFIGVLRTIRHCHPAVAVLENVIGLK